MQPQRVPPFLARRRGFNLIEAAIVLGVIGLVIGGIWVAASDVSSKMRVNETAQGILKIVSAARPLLPFSSYPSTLGATINVTSTMSAARAIPASFQHLGGVARTPMGTNITIEQSCWTTCPMLAISWRGPGDSWQPGRTSPAECIQLVRRLATIMRDNSNMYYIQIQVPGNSGYQMLYPPINPSIVDCPANYNVVNVWFRP
jgi:hypothetical protein